MTAGEQPAEAASVAPDCAACASLVDAHGPAILSLVVSAEGMAVVLAKYHDEGHPLADMESVLRAITSQRVKDVFSIGPKEMFG